MRKFVPTPAQRKRVAICAGGGMSHEEIALGMSISRPTLEKYFAHELSVGAYEKRQEVLEAMHRTAKNGNVAAQKAYIAMTTPVAAPPLPSDEHAKRSGKKERAQADALTAQSGTDWESLLQTGSTPLQ